MGIETYDCGKRVTHKRGAVVLPVLDKTGTCV